MTSPALELTGFDKRFDQVIALHVAGIVVRRGAVHEQLGENGAGKSTLAGSPPLVVAMNPTRGLDLAATVDVHHRLIDDAAGGEAVGGAMLDAA